MHARRLLASRLPRYAAAAAATIAATPAFGSVVYDSNAFSVGPNAVVNWDIDGGGATDFTFRNSLQVFTAVFTHTHVTFTTTNALYGPHFRQSHRHTYTTRHPVGSFQHMALVRANANNNWIAQNSFPQKLLPLPLGAAIGPVLANGLFANVNTAQLINSGPGTGPNLTPGSQYIGFRFQISGQTYYGWASINFAVGNLTVNDWAYDNTPGANITVGDTGLLGSPDVPEPAQAATGLGLLALGAAGVSAYKRRQKAAA